MPAEQRELALSARSVERHAGGEALLHELFAERAALAPEAAAVSHGDDQITYAELRRRARRLAALLRGRGAGPDVVVGLHLGRSIEMVVAILGVLEAQAAYLPLDPSYPPDRLSFMIADAKAPLVITDGRAPLPSDLPTGVVVVGVDDVADDPVGTRSVARAHPDNLAYVLYTSGTTGTPKGVLVTHRNVVRLFETMTPLIDPTSRDVWSVFHSFSFDFSVFELWGALLHGGRAVIVPFEVSRSPPLFGELLRHEGVTVLCQTPSAFRQLLLEHDPTTGVGDLRLVVFGGEALGFESLRPWIAAHGDDRPRLINMYGITETTVHVTWRPVRAADLERGVPSCIGDALPDLALYLLDGDLEPVPPGAIGEIYVGGPGLSRGYLGRPELTATRFVPNPHAACPGERLYRSGDLGRRLPGGDVAYLGRADKQVQLRGFRIELGEVEAALLQHPAVGQAVVVLREHRGTDILVAYVVPHDAKPLSWREVRRSLARSLPEHMVPSAFVELDTLPRTANGKVDRDALPAPQAGQGQSSEYVAPTGSLETTLCELWQDVLGAPRVGVRDDFFELGGHSILATQLMARIRAALGVDLALHTVFSSRTVAELAKVVSATTAAHVHAVDESVQRAPPAEPRVASFGEERLWFLDQLIPQRATYNVPFVARLHGAIDPHALEAALRAIVERHDVLRTLYTEREGRPLPIVRADARVHLPVEHVDPGSLQARVQAEITLPFELARGALLRARLLHVGPEDHVLTVTLHHVVSDGWSMGLLVGELSTLYAAAVEGRPAALPPLPIQYADFAAWQRRRAAGSSLDEPLAAYKRELADLPPPIELPSNRPRPPVRTGHGGVVRQSISAERLASVASFAAVEGATVFMVLATALGVLLSRYGGRRDVVVGAPVANRSRAEVEPLIGFFVNTVPLRFDVEPSSSVRELLAQVRRTCLAAYARQDVPFERVVEALGLPPDLGYNPIFQVMLAFDTSPPGELALPGVRVRPMLVHTGTAVFDLTVTAKEDERGGLRLCWEYASDWLEAAMVESMAEHYLMLLDAMTSGPERAVSDLPSCTEAERRAHLEWNDTRSDRPRDPSLARAFEEQVRRTPEAIALADDRESLTYRQLNRRANVLAHRLMAQGVGPEVGVGVCLSRSTDLVAALLAIVKAGGAYVPLDPDYPPERLGFMVRDASVPLVLTGRAEQGALPRHGAKSLLLEPGWADGAADGDSDPSRFVSAEQLAYVLYTSGSTGRPKGVMISQGALSNYVHWMLARWPQQPGDRVLHRTPIGFDPSLWEFWLPLLSGAKLVLAKPEGDRDLPYQVDLVRTEGVTVLGLVPALLELFLAEPAAAHCTSLKYVFCGGEALPPELVERHFAQLGVELVNLYGPTETTIAATFWPCERATSGRDARPSSETSRASIPIGRPIANTRTYILDADQRPTPHGVAGELYIAGAGVGRGYIGRPDSTAERFVPDPFAAARGARMYRTGDRARYLMDGSIEYLGRLDDQVKLRGVRIEVGEVEAALTDHPAVRQAFVRLQPDARGDKALVAYVVPSGAGDPSLAGLRGHLERVLPEAMIPAAIVAVIELPRTTAGKVDRNALPPVDLSVASSAAPHERIAPRGPEEEMLVALWQEVLRVAPVGVHDDFFALGGHSLLATQLVARVRRSFDLDLPLRDLFEARTPARLAARLADLRRVGSPPLPAPTYRGPIDGPVEASFAQERLWFLHELRPDSSTYNMSSAGRVRGPLDVRALQASLDALVARHESLRTTIVAHEGLPWQVVAAEATLPLEHLSLEETPPARRDDETARVARELARRPFDLSEGPLVRATLVRVAPEDHVLLVTMHHIVSDGWSMGVFAAELSTLYANTIRGITAALPSPSLRYVDYARWQRECLRGREEAELAYWRSRLAEAPALLALPTDRPRTRTPTHRGARRMRHVSAGVADRVRALARQEGATTFMVLLAAFQWVLSRWSGQDDVVVGTPIANRTLAETENVIGPFLNSLCLRTRVDHERGFGELLRQARETCLGAYAHQDVPFERLVEALAPERDPGFSPLFQVFLNMDTGRGSGLSFEGCRVEDLPIDDPDSKLDLTLFVREGPEGIELDCVYATELFDVDRIDALLEQIELALDSSSAAPDRPLFMFALQSAATASVLPDPGRPLRAEPADALLDRFARWVRSSPDAVAAEDPHQSWTYREVDRASRLIARRLMRATVGSGDLVAVIAHRSAPLLAVLLGVLRAGAAFALLDPAYPAARLEKQLRRARPRAIVPVVATTFDLAPVLAELGVEIVEPLPPRAGLTEAPTDAEAPRPHGSLAYVAFTSGTTGEPKAVAGTLEPIEHFLGWYANAFALGPDDRFSVLSGLSHDPLLRDLFAPVWVGGRACFPDPDVARVDGRWLRDARITVAHATPALAELLLGGLGARALPDLRLMCFAGDALGDTLMRHAFECAPRARCVNFYGATETPQAMGWYEGIRAGAESGVGSTVVLGRGVDGAQLLVVRGDAMLASVGELGEIWIRSPHLARPLDSGEVEGGRFRVNPFRADVTDRVYRTGDLGRFRPDGSVTYAGRADRQLKLRGFRIEPGEIEAAILTQPAVRAAHVAALGSGGERRIAAWVVAPEGAAVSGLAAALGRLLPPYMVPSAFVVMPALPLTPAGKIDTARLPAPAAPRRAGQASPRGPTEEAVCSVLSDVLGGGPVGPHDDFFALGGHSLLAARAIARLRALFGIELPLAAIFEGPNAADLAARVDASAAAGAPPEEIPRHRPDEDAPLSFAQQRLWFLHELEPESTAYNLYTAVRVRGELSVEAWHASIAALARRHASLRTRFVGGATGPRQRIDEEPGWKLASLEAPGGTDGAVAEAALLDAVRAEAMLPFDLERGPLVRATLWRVHEREHVFLLAMHHIVADGWSLGILMSELGELYAASRAGEPAPLPALALSYADYADWQRESLGEEVVERHLDYWRRELAGAPTSLELFGDGLRAPGRRPARRTRIALPVPLCDAIRDLSRSEGVTPFMTLLAAFGALLSRYSGQRDLLIGSPIAGRIHPGTEGIVGFFVNSLVLRVRLEADPSFRALLARTKAACLGAYAHQALPFERLVEDLQPDRDLLRTPLFQVMFMLQNQPVGDLQLPKAEVDYLERHVESAKFDLVVALHEEGGAFVGRLDWAEDLFDAETADTIPAHFSTLLEGLVREPDRPASRHAFLTQGERQRLVVEYNRTSAPYSDERCLHQQIETHVDAAPNAVAVVAGDRRLSYTELDVRANQLAHRLATMGVRRGDRVALCLGRSVEIVVAVFGILKAGAAWVGIDPAVPRLRVAAMVRDAGAAAMVTEKSFVDLVPSGMVHLLVDEHAAELARQPHGRPAVPVAPDDLAYMLYTSGSTGEPKGACIAHRGVLSLIADIQRRAPLSPGARASFWTSIGFDVSVYEMFSALLVGAAVWVVPEELRADPDGFAEWLFEQHIDAAYVPPFGIDAFARAVERKGSTALSRLFVGVEPIPERTLARIAVRGPGLSILNSYGPTEATVCCTLYRCPPQESSERPSAIGFPTANTELYVLDEHLAPVARGATGELFIGGVGVGLGYWGRPTETAQRFLPDPFSGRPGARLYRTGDLVRMRADLALVFLGRIDRQVKLSGHRIELGEIETTLATHPAVRGAAAVVRSDGRGHDHLAAYVVPAAGEDVSPAALREHLESRLPRWMLPRAFVLMEALPLTHSGKIDRDALPDPSFDAPASEGVHRTPRDALEHALATIVAEVLGVSRVGIDDDFFALGANSLLVTQVIARARRALGVHLPLRAVFEAPTVAGLAARVATLLPRPRHSLPPARRGPQAGPLPLSFSQTRLWFLQQLEPEQVAYTIRSALRLRGPLDVDALGRSLAEIVRRHEVLRTTYLLMDGEPRQLVRDDRELQVSFSSVESLDAAGREDGARAELASDACRPFDLEHDLPLRVRLVRLGPSDHVLYLAVHHIASDGWSLDVLFRELGALYRAFGHGELSPLPELDLQYADYAVRQRQTVTSDRMETVAEGDGFASQLAYWKGALAGAPTLDLPTDRPRPRVRTTRGASCTDLIGTADRRRVQAMSVEHGVTQHMIFLATFATVLARFAAQYDLVVGTPVAGRTRAELEPLIGCFINVLPLRIDLSGDPTFRELLGRVRETALSAYANQDVPFERVLEELHPERDVGRTPVFQVSFNMFHVADERLELPEIAVEGFRAGGPTARFDLALYARDSADGVRLELVYATDLFEKQSADLLLAHVTSVLRAAATDVDQRISEVPLLDEADAARLRAGSLRARPTGPAVPFEEADLAGSIVDRFDRQVHQHHSSVAVLTRNERWTYGRLYDVSRRLAAALHAAGICEGKRVALLFDHGGAMVAGMIGVLRAGAAYVPLDRAHPSKRLALVAQDAEVAAIVTDRGGRSLAMPLANGLPVIVIDDLVEVQTLEIPPVSPRSLAYLLYTSGSTGRPKGVMQSHENVLHHIRAYTHGLRIRHDDRLTLLSTYTFDAAVMDIYGALLNGATLLSARVLDEDPSRLAAWLADEGATILHATPTVFRLLTSDLEAHSMPSVRLVVLGGEPCYRDDALLCRRVFGPGTIFVNGCGPTESTLALQHFMDGHSELRTQRAPVGHPVLDTDVYLAGADGQRLGTYGVGEIVIESQHVALGYWNQPDETRLAFESDASRPRLRRYRSGDVGRLLADGSIEFVGRKDQQLKIRGHRLEPGEIEAAIARHSSVREAAIVAASSADQRVLVAFVSAAPGETLDASELRAFLRQELPEYMLPSTIVVLPTLPLTTTGKVDRAALLAYDLPAPISTERVQPSDPLEQELADLWADVLGVGVGALDDFFDLGGHSLLALRILARVEQKFGQRLPVAAFFQAPTVRDMAVMLAGMLVSSGESGGRPPRFSEAPPRGSSER